MLYRIFTENKNHKALEKLVGEYFDGFTLIKSQGFWRLQKENSLIIEVITEDTQSKLEMLCRDIKLLNRQESVILQKIQNEMIFI